MTLIFHLLLRQNWFETAFLFLKKKKCMGSKVHVNIWT